jgi:transposase-like protein
MEPMKGTRKTYTAEFKAEAVKLVKSGSKDVTQLARELEVSRQLLYDWVRQSDSRKGQPLTDVFPGRGKRTAEQMELDRLRRENAELREANEFLKKAKAFFAKHRR